MSKEDLEDKILNHLKKDKEIADIIERNPSLRTDLEISYEKAFKEGKGLLYSGKFIDAINKGAAVVKGIGMWTGPGTGYLIRGLTKIGQLALMKIPYSIYYMGKGGNKGSAAAMGAWEAIKYLAPFGDLADVIPVYGRTAKKFIEDKTKDYFLERLKNKKLEPAKVLSMQEFRKRKDKKTLDDVLVPAAKAA
jgi:hypothetical protein